MPEFPGGGQSYCGLTAADYLAQAKALLPRGLAWPRDDDAVIAAYFGAISVGLERVNGHACKLLNAESFPCFSYELLPDWERAFGLPDPCAYEVTGLAERRATLCFKVTERGGQSSAYFIARAAVLGYGVEIDERRPFTCGFSPCGGDDECGSDDVRFFWTLTVLEPRVTWFECGVSECGSLPLAEIRRAEDLECILQGIKPAHSILTVGYEGV